MSKAQEQDPARTAKQNSTAPMPTIAGGQSLLRTVKCTIRFGGLVAVDELDMSVQDGEIYGLIGPNGAGKTTIFNLLTGVYNPTSGEIYFQQERPASK